MNKIKKTIIILTLIIICLILLIIYIQKKSMPIDGLGADYIDIEYTAQPIKSASVYYTVEYYIKRYLNLLSFDINNIKEEEKEYAIVTNEKEKREIIYNLLSKDFIEKNNITISNISEHINFTVQPLDFVALKIQGIEFDNSIREYRVYGRVFNKETKDKVDYKYFKVCFDIDNQSYSIEPIEKCNNINTIELARIEEVEKTGNNSYGDIRISEQDLLDRYIAYYKDAALNYPEEIYNMLDYEYRTVKFADLDDFKKYVDKREDLIKKMMLSKYKKEDKISSKRYICIDNDNNYFIIEQKSIMDFSLILDTYTIDLPEFIEKYENSDSKGKVELNINKIVEALNNKDYEYVYKKLADSFKENYFKSLESFIEYAKITFGEGNKAEYNKFAKTNDYFTYEITLKNKTSKITKTIIMQLLDETNFVMSFNIN